MDTWFQLPYMEPHHYYNRNERRQTETLRKNLNLPEKGVITALIDSRGILKYINTNASDQLSDSLTQINTLIKNPTTTEKE